MTDQTPGAAAAEPSVPAAPPRSATPAWLAPVLVAVIGVIAMQVHFAATIVGMILPPAGIVGGVLVTAATGVVIALVFRLTTARLHPIAAALLALVPAVLHWGSVLGFTPYVLTVAMSEVGMLIMGAAMGALAMLVLPDPRWRRGGAIASSIIGVLVLVAVLLESAG
ncbi:hypothetical protein BCL57_000305 [Agromyces flavus]|uniref:Uncharacterized protein n=1 Tax=Agromyces flavus TaxID=589382 RepID=A0A1H1WID8_9MICO|nr:hypothetical protein [Agromyces flavus]MCP2366163.1 hypothetical protein [Agromyces flavus]GGI44126.1 hypothetical protein GCM10010932_03050 [Agromyces flavus]SDS95949.1 hypothetical protein SAMN04489721_2234 [Agromyces flavus]